MMDPILTPMITAGLTSAGLGGLAEFSLFGITHVVGHLLSFVIVAGISAGLYLLTAPPVPKPEDGKVPVQESIPPRQYCYGIARVSGALMLRETNQGAFNGGSGVGGGNLATVVALASHEITQFNHIYLNDNRVTFNGGSTLPPADDAKVDGLGAGSNTTAPWKRYAGDHVYMSIRRGLTPETHCNMFLSHNFTSGPWPSTARGDGIAQILMNCNDAGADTQSQIYPYGAPNPNAVVAGYKVFDPRIGTHDPHNPATWSFSQNSALCILHFLCFSEFGFQYPYDIAIAPVVNEWKHAADLCGDNILVKPVSGGLTIKRYELGGFSTTDVEQKSVLQAMLNTCDGWLVRRGDGSCLIRVGVFEASGVTITDADIIGYSYQKGLADDQVVNRLNLQFTSRDHEWTQIECDPWDWNADQIRRGHFRESTMDLKWCQDYRAARRIGKREFVRQKEPLRGSLDLYLSGINAAYERWIYINSANIPALSNRYIENRGARFVLTGDVPSIHMEFIGVDPTALEDWNADADEGRAPPVLENFVG